MILQADFSLTCAEVPARQKAASENSRDNSSEFNLTSNGRLDASRSNHQLSSGAFSRVQLTSMTNDSKAARQCSVRRHVLQCGRRRFGISGCFDSPHSKSQGCPMFVAA